MVLLVSTASILPEPLPHAALTHDTRSLQKVDRAELRAAHVMALEMADVLSDGQYVDIDPRAVAVEPATEAHAEFMLAPYEEYALIMLVHVDSSVVDMEHHAAGPELLGGSGEGGGGDAAPVDVPTVNVTL